MQIKSFRDLSVWQLSIELAVEVYALCGLFPADERFGLSLQLRRSVVSIPSNIAEGSGYGRSRRHVHHLRIALGSDLEVQTQLLLVDRLSLAPADRVSALTERATEVGKMLNGLIRSLENH